MTPQQLELKELLDSQPTAWAEFTKEQRDLLSEILRPDGPFTDEQRELLRDRWLPTTSEQLAQARDLLPPKVGVARKVHVDGGLWLSAYLLTDCIQPTDTYHAIAPILTTLPITLVPPDRFPQPESEDI